MGWHYHYITTDDDDENVTAWAWVLVDTAKASFLETYSIVAQGAAFVPPNAAWSAMLFAAELQKALYEIRYELGHRPEWVWIPVEGLRRLASRLA